MGQQHQMNTIRYLRNGASDKPTSRKRKPALNMVCLNMVCQCECKDCKDCKRCDPYIERDVKEYDTAYGWCEAKKKDVCVIGWECMLWIPKLILLALLLSGCSQTTATYEDGVATVTRTRILMTEDIDSFSYDATDGSFTLDGYKSDMTKALSIIDRLLVKYEEMLQARRLAVGP